MRLFEPFLEGLPSNSLLIEGVSCLQPRLNDEFPQIVFRVRRYDAVGTCIGTGILRGRCLLNDHFHHISRACKVIGSLQVPFELCFPLSIRDGI